jgi:hypothetical protein
MWGGRPRATAWPANYRLASNPAQKQLPPGTPTGRSVPFSAAAARVDGDTATFSIPLERFPNGDDCCLKSKAP